MTKEGGEHREDRDRGAADRPGVLVPEGLLSTGGAASREAAPRYCLRSTLEPFDAGDGTVRLVDAGGRVRAALPEAEPWQRRLIGALDADGRSLPELVGRTGAAPEQVTAAVEALREAGLVEEAVGVDEGRHGRQLMYFASRLGSRSRATAAQDRLRRATVVIVGCGGLGSWVATGLVCAGVGRLRLVDPDHVALDNLNRQILFRHADVGLGKVDAAARSLQAFDPDLEIESRRVRIESAGDALTAVEGCDAIVEAADWPVHRLADWLGAAATRHRIPHISLAQQPPVVRVGPLRVPGRTACHACWQRAAERRYPLYGALKASRIARGLRPSATTGFASGAVGSIAAAELVHLLSGVGTPATLSRGWMLDLLTLESSWEQFAVEPCDCW